MNGLTGEFVWRVPNGGFRIQRGIYRRGAARYARGGISHTTVHGPHDGDFAFYDSPTEFLVPNVPENDRFPSGLAAYNAKDSLSFVMSGSEVEEYRPLYDTPALFREFADIEPSDEGIMTFANRWGALGSEATCEISLVGDDDSELEKTSPNWGEMIGLWITESGIIHDAVALWDAVKYDRVDILKASIWIEGDTVNWHSVPDGWSITGADWVSSPEYFPERLEQIKRHGLARAATFIVQDLVNDGLRARIHEQLTWDETKEKLAVRIQPINLIGALWLQLANAIEGGHDYGQCSVCASWFEIAPGSGRPDKQYCSDACRMRAYRKRKSTGKKPKKKTVRQSVVSP